MMAELPELGVKYLIVHKVDRMARNRLDDATLYQRLVAMAGERLHLDGWTEISAVCTAPTHRRRGLASRLVNGLAVDIEGRSERAFLHVMATNASAIALYGALGFRLRRTLTITVAMPQPILSRR